MKRKLAVIGVGNMARAILAGIISKETSLSEFILYDKNEEQYRLLPAEFTNYRVAANITEAVSSADCVLLSVKPQNFSEIFQAITEADHHNTKLFISIAAGIDTKTISEQLHGANVVRVLPNLPITVGMGVSLICKNDAVDESDMQLVRDVFSSSGSYLMIEESDMNRMIGVASSSPAYVFQFADAIYQGALSQGLPTDHLMDVICDMIIGSATLLKQSGELPRDLIAKVCSKGGTTERAMQVLEDRNMNQMVLEAMIACTLRANELGESK